MLSILLPSKHCEVFIVFMLLTPSRTYLIRAKDLTVRTIILQTKSIKSELFWLVEIDRTKVGL